MRREGCRLGRRSCRCVCGPSFSVLCAPPGQQLSAPFVPQRTACACCASPWGLPKTSGSGTRALVSREGLGHIAFLPQLCELHGQPGHCCSNCPARALMRAGKQGTLCRCQHGRLLKHLSGKPAGCSLLTSIPPPEYLEFTGLEARCVGFDTLLEQPGNSWRGRGPVPVEVCSLSKGLRGRQAMSTV